MYKAAPVVLALLTASLFLGGTASAFHVRKTAGGTPVHWEADTITVVVDPSVAQLDPRAIEAATRAFAAWGDVQGTGAPSVVLTEGVADAVGFREGDDSNKNTLRYEPDGYAPAGGALAITVLTFDAEGKIVDADIVLNGGGSRGFAVLEDSESEGSSGSDGSDGKPHDGDDGKASSYDVEDVLTHEAGHFFGLAHNDGAADATMYYATARGETRKRVLSADDEAGFRSLYPEPQSGGVAAACSASPGSGETAPGAVGAGLLAAAFVAAARRRRGPSGSLKRCAQYYSRRRAP